MPAKRYPAAIALIGVPVPGKTNPYIVSLLEGVVVEVDVDVAEAERTRASLQGSPPPKWSLEIAVKSYVDAISSRLEQDMEVVVEYSSPLELPLSTIFSAISLAVIETVVEAGGYHFTREELLEAANSVDEDAGTDYDYMPGLRLAMLGQPGKVFVYRVGEEPVVLGGAGLLEIEMVGEEQVKIDSPEGYGDSILSLLTKLAGMNVVEAAERLREGEEIDEVFEQASRIDNSIYYALYGLTPIERCKWTPSFQSGFGVCRAGTGLGEKARIYL